MSLSAWYRQHLAATIVLLIVGFQFLCIPAKGQADTLSINLHQADKLFLENNLELIAARYDIDANQALIRQAKVWDNPLLSVDQNIYDRQGKFFKHDNTSGQVYVQVMQLIKTAGKRNKLAQLAKDNTAISGEQFDELVRTLRYTLMGDLFEISHQLKQKNVYEGEIQQLQKLVTGMDVQLKSGNISLKDNMRIRALLFSLQNEVVNIEAQVMPLQSEVKLLLKNTDSAFIKPAMSYYLPDLIQAQLPPKKRLLDSAIQNRPDAKMARLLFAFQKHNLAYQEALAKPDINVGSEYDQRSSYAPDYVGLAISFPLNIFNKNRGNIASAKYSVTRQQTLEDAQIAKITSDISAAYDKIKFYQRVNNPEQLEFSKRYDTLFQNMLTSYQQRQISLLEFIDFADAFKDTKLKLLDQHNALMRSIIDLNYLTGKDIITFN